nr:putative ribonuclease H-like domain-containing protein [Tanacetum cinerariifolium]
MEHMHGHVVYHFGLVITKDETSSILRKFITEIENLKDLKVQIIRCDNRGGFRNKELNDFCSQKGIKREFSNARTPQQNGVAERRNRSLIEAARTMLADAKLFVTFWEEVVNTACYVQNRVLINKAHNKTLYELFNGTKVDASKDEKKDVSSLRYIVLPNWGHEEHLEFTSSQPQGVRHIGTKWVLKKKKDERGIVVRNKARLVAQGHTQEEGIDYDEVFAPVARIKAIRLFLAYASFMGFTVYQMDVKSAFLYGTIDEEVYVMQPPGFQDPKYPARVCKVEKAMYGLNQAPRAWYGTLSKYLLSNGFQRGTIDQTLFIRSQRGNFILVQVYVDDIIFGSSNPQLCREFEALMHEKFQMSAMGELNFFLGLQVLQKEDGIFLSQDKHQVTPKECHLHAVKRIFRYLKGHPKLGLWYPKDSPFDLVAFSDSDYGGATQDRKSTSGGCQFLGRRLISWQCKKQTIVATPTTEAEYVAAASCCGQVHQLLDYGYNFMNTNIYIDNNSAICIVINPVYHSKTTHIEIKHHFIRDCFEKKIINVDHIHTDENVADLLTKPFDAGRFQLHTAKTLDLVWIWLCGDYGKTIVATSTTKTKYVAAASCCGQVLWIQNQLLDYGLSMPCETLSKEISTSILRLLHTAKTLDLVWIWLGDDYGNVFLNWF